MGLRDAIAGALLNVSSALGVDGTAKAVTHPTPREAPGDAWNEEDAKQADAVCAFLNANLGAFRAHGFKTMFGDGPTVRVNPDGTETPISDDELNARPMGKMRR